MRDAAKDPIHVWNTLRPSLDVNHREYFEGGALFTCNPRLSTYSCMDWSFRLMVGRYCRGLYKNPLGS
eukprot:scaffold2428_cov412-Prasinococcus_capsulatus_cf.AAC.8